MIFKSNKFYDFYKSNEKQKIISKNREIDGPLICQIIER